MALKASSDNVDFYAEQPKQHNMEFSPLYLSLKVAFCATAIAFLIGLPLAYVLSLKRVPLRSLWEGALLLPFILPPTVLGYYLLTILGREGLPARWFQQLFGHPMPLIVFTWQGAVIATSVISIPLLARTVQLALLEINQEVLEAALCDGANRSTRFYHIQLPLASRGIVAGTSLAFARALGDFGVTLMIGGNIPDETRTLPIAVYDAVNSGNDKIALIYTLILSGICLAFSMLITHFTTKQPNAP